MSTSTQIDADLLLGRLSPEQAQGARAHAEPERITVDPEFHATVLTAASSVLRGDLPRARHALAGLDEDQLAEVMRAGAVLVAVAGGVE